MFTKPFKSIVNSPHTEACRVVPVVLPGFWVWALTWLLSNGWALASGSEDMRWCQAIQEHTSICHGFHVGQSPQTQGSFRTLLSTSTTYCLGKAGFLRTCVMKRVVVPRDPTEGSIASQLTGKSCDRKKMFQFFTWMISLKKSKWHTLQNVLLHTACF